MKNRRRHSVETKTKAVLETLKKDQTLAEVAAKYEVHPKLLAQWKQEFLEKPSVAGDNGAERKRRALIQQQSLIARKKRKTLKPI
ncbi:hypothetical protein COW64_09485 [bacterium (Candidatus Blackallbacteria) CG18_big_fil_WC_8_21_14_2_50_49_26]|nr:MAG: hypothetical protein COW64_09485 [bacterium (Candidatus Blackallbacteria) CG18_big_fil_WC_8_21_14_2_50_49_26]